MSELVSSGGTDPLLRGSAQRLFRRGGQPASVKRAIDVLGAAGLLLLFGPVMLLLAFLVRRDGGPALFGHQRIGLGGAPFRCWKFRSMVVDAEAQLGAHLARDPEAAREWAATRKLRRDPRITRLGRVLRATSLDELPQLLNVLRGEMSLVGPRPVVRAELEEHYGSLGTAAYLQVRPGITGLWQVSGRSDTDYQWRVALDLRYVQTWTILGDIRILLLTLPSVLMRRGAA